MTTDNKLTFLQKLAMSELPRRIIGSMLAVFVPGAGHVVLGYPRVGWIVAGVTLSLFALAVLGAVLVVPPLFLLCGALILFGTVVSVVSIFALPPGPTIKNGVKSLWPVLLLFATVRAAISLTGAYLLQNAPVPDELMAPALHKNDTVLVGPSNAIAVGDVVYFEEKPGVFGTRRVASIGDTFDLVTDKDTSHVTARREQLRGKALFVFQAGGVDGRGRIWKRLSR